MIFSGKTMRRGCQTKRK